VATIMVSQKRDAMKRVEVKSILRLPWSFHLDRDLTFKHVSLIHGLAPPNLILLPPIEYVVAAIHGLAVLLHFRGDLRHHSGMIYDAVGIVNDGHGYGH
jgi:hypothetical protein